MRLKKTLCLIAAYFCLTPLAEANDANRLTYLDAFCDPYYVGPKTAKLTTPQWIGEQGVEAAAILSNDDLRDAKNHEQFLRPIVERLKKIDGPRTVQLHGK